jgi:hypothetical protein
MLATLGLRFEISAAGSLSLRLALSLAQGFSQPVARLPS